MIIPLPPAVLVLIAEKFFVSVEAQPFRDEVCDCARAAFGAVERGDHAGPPNLGCRAEVCIGKVEAIGFVDLDGDGHLDIALIQATLAPPDRYLKTPIVVRGYGDGNFAVDETLTAALNERGGITTIGALQRAVSQLRAEATQRKGRDRAKTPSVR